MPFPGLSSFSDRILARFQDLRCGKFTSIFKKSSIFQNSDRFTQNGGNRSGSAPAHEGLTLKMSVL